MNDGGAHGGGHGGGGHFGGGHYEGGHGGDGGYVPGGRRPSGPVGCLRYLFCVLLALVVIVALMAAFHR